jgi:hypothetical protein
MEPAYAFSDEKIHAHFCTIPFTEIFSPKKYTQHFCCFSVLIKKNWCEYWFAFFFKANKVVCV